MRIRQKTIRRLLILFSIALLLVGGLVTWVLISQHRMRSQVALLRTQAIAAYTAQDYASAASLFSEYLSRSHAQDSDAEAVYDFAKSRLETPMDGNRQVYEAIGLYERYLQLDTADSRDASHTLLSLYIQARYNKEGLTLAQRLLATNPKDLAALHGVVLTLRGDQNFTAALQACQRTNAINPDDLEWQATELDLMGKAGAPAAQVLEHARQLHDANPNQSTFTALWAFALLNNRDQANARTAIQEAAKLPPGKPENVLQIVRLLDITRSFDLSDDLLNRAISADPTSPRLMRLVVQRTFERSGPQAVVDRCNNINAATADSEVLGFAAFANFQANHPADAQSMQAALALRKDDPAKAWTIILQTSSSKDHPAPGAAIKQYVLAARLDPTNAVALLLLGQTYASMGESEAALRYWNSATEVSPSWALPFGLMSRAQSVTGQYADALRSAEAARLRAPGTPIAETTYAVAWYGLSIRNAATVDPKDAQGLSDLLDTIQKTWPNEPNTLPIYVANLVHNGNAESAKSVIATAITSTPPTPLATLLQLAQVSRQEKLDQDAVILEAAEKAYGPQPTIASARAATQDPTKVLASFDATATGHAGDAAWQLTGARLADSVGDRSALPRWIAVGDAQPKNLAVQSAILESPSRRLDTAFWRRTVDRLKTIDGADRHVVELEDARVRMSGPLSESELAGLIGALQKLAATPPDDAAAHRLLADAFLKSSAVDHLSRATTEMQRAHDLRPADFETTAQLVQLLTVQSQRPRATALIDALVRDNRLTSRQKLWAADVDGQIGRPDAGIALLAGDTTVDPLRNTLLARLYQQAGQSEKAAALYQQLLTQPDAPADALTGGAEFFARAGQVDSANQFVARIEKLPLQPGAAAMIRARVEQLLGKPQDATATLTAATKATPAVEQLWQELAGLQLRSGRLDDAQHTVSSGLQANANSVSLKAMQTQLARVRTLTPDTIAPLLDVLCHQPALPVLDQTLKILADSASPEQSLTALRQLSDQQPTFVPLQELLAARYASAGSMKDAAEMATRAANASVNDPAPLRMLCAIQTASGDSDGLRQSAARWRALTPADTFDPDMSLARAYLNQSRPDPDAAARQLKPYVTSTNELQRDAAIPIYASALIGGGKSVDAEALLKPRLSASHWRLVWIELASLAQKDRATALAWMQTAAPLIPADATDEKLALADAWERIGTRFDLPDAHASAMEILKPIVATTNVPAAAWATWASANQSTDNLAEAEHGWRQFLAARPNEPLAKNNLAYLLLLQGGTDRLTESEKLCREAITQLPGVSGFYDTLARVLLVQGKTADAMKNFRASLSRDPSNLEAMIGLADLLQADSKSREELKTLLIRIDAGLRAGTSLTPPIKQQLDRVKSAVTSSM